LTISHVFILESGDSIIDGIWAVVLVFAVFVFVTYETKLTNIISVGDKGLDSSMCLKHFLDIGIAHFCWNILEVQVVGQLLCNFS
jgi:hypothetical protein